MTDRDYVDIVTMLRSPDRFEPYTCNAAADEIERLRAERDEARKERDEATRILHAMVEHIYGITPLDKNPKHDCGFDHRPDLGSCKFCENWTAANVLLYGEEYATEDTND